MVPKAIRHFRVTTDSRNTKEVSPNVLRRCFKTQRPNACWLSDVTYIPTREGWLYLAAVLDVYSRANVGWAMSQTLGGQLTTDALAMAIARRRSRTRALRSRLNLRNVDLPGPHSEAWDPPEHEP